MNAILPGPLAAAPDAVEPEGDPFLLAAEADDRWNWYLSGGLGLNLLF